LRHQIQGAPIRSDIFEVILLLKNMMNSSYTNRLLEMIPEEFRLIHQAKSGDANAFVELYDVFVERVYRYIYFLAPNNAVAEGLTFQTFLKAWEHIDRYQIFGSSYTVWLFSIARNQVNAYYRTHKNTAAPDTDFTLALKGGNFRREFQVIRDSMRLLTGEQQQVLLLKFMVGMSIKDIALATKMRDDGVLILQMHGLQVFTEHLKKTELSIDLKGFQRVLEKCLMRLVKGTFTLDECLLLYPEYANQLSPLLETALLLNLGRDVEPLPTFTSYTRSAVTQYMQSHPRQRRIVMPVIQRTALTFAVLIATLLVTGTAQAQSALPGEKFYTWKRASEQVWRAISPDPVATDTILAERRLNEWIAVAKDPMQNFSAKIAYLEALTKLESSNNNMETLAFIVVPSLQLQQAKLNNAGLAAPELDNYLIVAVANLPDDVVIQSIPTQIASTATVVPPTATDVLPTATDIPSTATVVPPTATDVPPTATVVPPTATDVPQTATDIPSTATDVPPTATDIPSTATDIPPTVEPTFIPEVLPAE
jgi:DNA-directed RNA polymerase specialized sigma24 family protein